MSEPLHPELEEFVLREPTSGAVVLRHPLLITPYCEDLHHTYNLTFLQRRTERDRCRIEGDHRGYVTIHEQPYRLSAFAVVEEDLTDEEYWTTLGEIWTGSDVFWNLLDEWCRVLKSDRPNRHLFMTPPEQEVFNALPEVLTIYRGYVPSANQYGLSYSRSRKVALSFGTDLLSRSVKKGGIFAYVDRKGEQELILHPDYRRPF